MQPLPDLYPRLLGLIASMELPQEAQRAITRSGIEPRRALAANASTSIAIINELVRDDDRDTHHAALRRTDDIEQLTRRLDRDTTCCAINAYRNPAVPADRLAAALEHPNAAVRLAAYVNPATPLTARAAVGTASVVQMVNVGSFLGSRVVRSHEALLTNPFLYDRISEFDVTLRRAGFADPDLSLEQYHLLRKTGHSRYARRHPVFVAGDDWRTELDNDRLLELKSPAADLWLVQSPATTVEEAKVLLDRKKHFVEPHIIARTLTRFGLQVIPGKRDSNIAQTRVTSTMWSNPAAAWYNDAVLFQAAISELTVLLPQLGGTEAWENFSTLAPRWTGDLPSLFDAAKHL